MALRCWTALGVFAAVVAMASLASAQDVHFRLDYSAPEACPKAEEFQHEVEARLEQGRIAGSAELARTYRVRVELSEERARVTLDFTDSDGSRATREVSGASCDEAVRAMALVTALAIEARVAEEAKTTPAGPPKGETPALPAQAPLPAPTPAPRAAQAEHRAVFGFGAAVGVERGFAPRVAPSVAAIAELLHDEHAWRALFVYSDTGPARIDAGSAEFSSYTLRVAACPWRLAFGGALSLVPCAGLEGGVVRAAGIQSERIAVPESRTKPWFAAHAIGRVELSPDPGLAFGIEGALGFPLTRHEFFLENPEVVVHTVPVVIWGASAGLVARFR